jgi:F0F1-type ATP synthase delta subunit
MESQSLIIGFICLVLIVGAGGIFWLRRTFVTSTDGVLARLNDEMEVAKSKQAQLNRKLAKADEDLRKKRAEAQELANKMRQEAEEESKEQREKIVSKAREESEDIILKAQTSRDRLKLDLEKENDTRIIRYSMEILNTILSEKSKGILEEVLINEFLENFRNIDMSRISPDIKEVDVLTLTDLDEKVKNELTNIMKEKLNRDMKINAEIDSKIGGGIIVKFGTMAVDGSIQDLIRAAGTELVSDVEERTV